jgi:hypothetical protein
MYMAAPLSLDGRGAGREGESTGLGESPAATLAKVTLYYFKGQAPCGLDVNAIVVFDNHTRAN